MPKSRIRKRNGKKVNAHQVVKWNQEHVAKEYKVDKIIKVRPKGAPTRNEFEPTPEGKAAYKKARKEFYEKTPWVEKRLVRVSIRRTSHTHPELLELFEEGKRPKGMTSIAIYKSMRRTSHVNHNSRKRSNRVYRRLQSS